MKKFFLAVIPLVFLSCATVVSFQVEHPPLIDLRNVNTITVIPFEWNSTWEYQYLSGCVTSALIDGIRRGRINFVNPYLSQNIYQRNYAKYADVYITGRITNVRANSETELIEEKILGNEVVRRYRTSRTVTVDIEYSYIRSANNERLGTFRKDEISTHTFEHPERRNNRTRRERLPFIFRQRGSLTERIAESAILKFSDTMAQELGPWTTTERRNIRGTGNDPRSAEAKQLVRQRQYGNALDLYSGIYGQTGLVPAGYNAAILLQATNKFPDALELLFDLQRRTAESGKSIPFYVRREITKISDFIYGFMVLEGYRNSE